LIDVWLGEDPKTNTTNRHMMFESTFDVLEILLTTSHSMMNTIGRIYALS